MSRETLALTRDALRGLPRRYREPLVLFCRLEGSHAQVAASLGLSEETVRQRIARARRKLRDRVAMVERDVDAARPRRSLAGAVVAIVWSGRSGRARASSGGLPMLGALAALVSAVVLLAGSVAVRRELAQRSSASSSLEVTSTSTSTSASAAIPQPIVLLGAGEARRNDDDARAPALTVTPARAPRSRLRHGPAVLGVPAPGRHGAPSISLDDLGAIAP